MHWLQVEVPSWNHSGSESISSQVCARVWGGRYEKELPLNLWHPVQNPGNPWSQGLGQVKVHCGVPLGPSQTCIWSQAGFNKISQEPSEECQLSGLYSGFQLFAVAVMSSSLYLISFVPGYRKWGKVKTQPVPPLKHGLYDMSGGLGTSWHGEDWITVKRGVVH